MRHTVNIINSTFASFLTSWRGTGSSKKNFQPPESLILFDQEADPECRNVREVLTELNLDVTIMPCPIGGKNFRYLKKASGLESLPVLYDTNVDEWRHGKHEIIAYLYKQYKGSAVPKRILGLTKVDAMRSQAASWLRLNSGSTVRKAKQAQTPLTLYSFESSPFSRPVRELLCELELPYHLINLGKQISADNGPAVFRFSLKPYSPLANSKREAFFNEHGNVQVPYLVDPNTDTALFESKAILTYLKNQYAL
jgi:glutathione S-transferase